MYRAGEREGENESQPEVYKLQNISSVYFILDFLNKYCFKNPCSNTPFSLSRELKEARVCSEVLSAERQELQSRVLQASEQLGRLQRELEQKETQVEALRREREDLRLLTTCQEQRLTQTHKDMEQATAELASLENILDLLHLREVCT